uniref:Uncharacterized protein n=1 Tax=Branchiostoma floridae TaxID=7739 RepID=C3Y4P1_BRAFL|eukprot:XP_002608688.1 hypothetical protein BRAFLDRAFT_120575 [Branchiostoma floridae]
MTGGRVMASLYFLMVVVAGFSTYVTIINSTTQVLVDWGVRRDVASVVMGTLVFLLGVPSAVNITFLAIQWFVAGLFLLGLNLLFVRYRARMSRWWSSLIAKQEDIPACCCGHRQDRGDRDNPMAMTYKDKEAPALEYNTID